MPAAPAELHSHRDCDEASIRETVAEAIASGERLAHPVPDYVRVSGASKSAVYDAISRGEIRSVRVGRRLLIPQSEFARLLTGDA
jgi:excisionase family DNA binding protein